MNISEQRTALLEFVNHLETNHKSTREYRTRMAEVLKEVADTLVVATTPPPFSYDPPEQQKSHSTSAEDALFTLADIIGHHVECWDETVGLYKEHDVSPPINFPVMMGFALKRLKESLLDGKRFTPKIKGDKRTVVWDKKE